MLEVEFTVDGSRCTTSMFMEDPDTYQGQIICIECGKRAWFTKAYKVRDYERTACFNAHHENGCNRATTILEAENMEGIDADESSDNKSADIIVNLDKTKHGSIDKTADSDKTTAPPHNWQPSPRLQVIGGRAGFPMDKSLRQILSYLIKNPEYGSGKSIRIITDSDRVMVEGMFRDNLVEVPHIEERHYRQEQIFWGMITSYTEKPNGSVWLNYGTWSQPSIILDSELKFDLMDKLKINSLERFKGSYFILVGIVGNSKKGKPILKTGFPKYMNFINYRETDIQ
ncbi:hypothetical protein C9I92_15230 [Photobacterium ganghwense]|uniref:Uncharacterized protein n=1 Tax=Photobacterium ganghwense TaxID=320778 RepID=A0A0J1K0L0_9GAMM|nr:hypothetical protein [Photobacterium ganghwense]KLV07997.1 hypothetical protein ABT57_14215 [Photobacterium ganghwense]PSU07105.1 hypothetical protein C9I92_15230 [Photobacterium ganghwense]